MTIQEILHNFAFDVQEGMSDDQIGEQAEHLAKKIEALVRKETIEDILQWGEEINYGLDEGVRAYAGVKGITL